MQTEEIFYKSPEGLGLFAKAYGPSNAALNVLCMHGLTRNHKDFEPMIDAVGGPYRYIAVDVRGRGRSERDEKPERYTPLVYAQDMIALLNHLGINSVALIGTSMGGLMSMVMMHLAPKRILGTVLNDVGPAVAPAGLTRIAKYVGEVDPVESWEAAAAATANSQTDVFPHYSSEDWLAFAKRTYRELEDGHVILDYDPAITRTVTDVRPSFKTRFSMWRLFAKLKKKPLLIIRGEMSDILAEKTVQLMLKRHKGAKLVTVPSVGHAPMLDEPEAVNAISGFLEQF